MTQAGLTLRRVLIIICITPETGIEGKRTPQKSFFPLSSFFSPLPKVLKLQYQKLTSTIHKLDSGPEKIGEPRRAQERKLVREPPV